MKPKMYSFLVYNSKHKKANEVNRNVVATISPKQYEYDTQWMALKSKDHRIGT